MVYRGKVMNGQIVLDGAKRLPDGTEVCVETVGGANHKAVRGSAAAILPFAGIWADQAEDLARSLRELRAMKEEEVRRQISQPDEHL